MFLVMLHCNVINTVIRTDYKLRQIDGVCRRGGIIKVFGKSPHIQYGRKQKKRKKNNKIYTQTLIRSLNS